MPCVLFTYMYRDGDNNKSCYCLILPSSGGLNLTEAERRIRSALHGSSDFIPEEIGATSLTPDDDFDETIDGPWHEFLGLEQADPPLFTDGQEDARTLLELVQDIEAVPASGNDWQARAAAWH